MPNPALPMRMRSAVTGVPTGWVQVTPSMDAADVRRLERVAVQLGLGAGATVGAAIQALAAHVNAGRPRPYDVRPTAGPRLSTAEVRAGAAGWAMPTYKISARHARLLHQLARRGRQPYSAVIRTAVTVLERQQAQAAAA